MSVVWRIGTDTRSYVADDLRGLGAKKTGGRWNRKGVAMTYTSPSRALACLEALVHLDDGGLPLNRYLVEVTIPDDLWNARATLDPATHVGWEAEPPAKVSLDWGDAWVVGRTSLLAEVPSIVVPEEFNVLINPSHPDLHRLTVKKVRKWTYDLRLSR